MFTRTHWLSLAIPLLGQIALPVSADEIAFHSGPGKVHLLELFTSEGCSSCPPAEAWLSKLTENAGLWHHFVPVAFHVDYWDGLGWRDRFASKEWTLRQRIYADRWKTGSVYTPGFVLDGAESRARQVPAKSDEITGTIALKISNRDVIARFESANSEAAGYDVYFATLGSDLSSNVRGGENQGRKLTHDFVVLSLQKAALHPGTPEAKFSIDPDKVVKSGAVAAWVTRRDDAIPIQATGGWVR